MNEIPKISITQDFVMDDHDDEMDSECTGNIEEAHTDIEDLDSDEKNSQIPSSHLLLTRKKVKSKKIDECATDIEDCQDSGSDDESDLVKSCSAHLSLNAFLDQGFIEETSTCSGGNKTKHSRKGKRPSLFVPVEDDGAITDCEDLNSSENEVIIEECPDDSKYDDFLIGNDDFSSVNVENSAFVESKKKKRLTASKNVSSSDSEIDVPTRNRNDLSDVENIAFSYQEDQPNCSKRIRHSPSAYDAEEIVLVASDNEGAWSRKEPVLDICVEFKIGRQKKSHRRHTKKNQNKNSLSVEQNPDEGITDVENLESSDDEGTNLQTNLKIPLAYVSSGDKPLTDIEDFDVEVDDDCVTTMRNDIKLPSPAREIIVMSEDKYGDPVAKVMPLVASANDSCLGIQYDYVDKG